MALRRQVFRSGNESLDRQLAALQASVDDALRALEVDPATSGKMVEVPALAAAGTFDVVHGLGRPARGWQVRFIERGAAVTSNIAIFYRTGATNDSNRLRLYATQSFVALAVWVY